MYRIDNTGTLQEGQIGASSTQRQWVGLSLSGDRVSVERVPPDMARTYLQSLDMEVGFLRRGHEIAEQFSTDDMAKNFIRAFNGTIFGIGETIVFDYHGQNLKATVKGLGIVEVKGGSASNSAGIIFERTDVNFMKAGDSLIKLKSSSKKCV